MKSKTPIPELETLGWTGAELARRIHVTEETVSRWRNGKRKTPGLLTAYLRLCVWIHEKGYRVP
ncbi:MAG: helix-turn-helix transcriptional regulator [Pseudomonadota bacterium]